MNTTADVRRDAALMTRKEVAAYLGVCTRSLDRLAATGALKPVRPLGSRAVRYRREDVLKWLESGCPQHRRR